jgi:hypothetical protein
MLTTAQLLQFVDALAASMTGCCVYVHCCLMLLALLLLGIGGTRAGAGAVIICGNGQRSSRLGTCQKLLLTVFQVVPFSGLSDSYVKFSLTSRMLTGSTYEHALLGNLTSLILLVESLTRFKMRLATVAIHHNCEI